MLGSTRDYLAEALRRDPDDVAGHSAYADLLTEEGDPRGEYISIRLMLEDRSRSSPERLRLEQRARELRMLHEREWYGDLAPFLLDPLGADDDLLAEPEATCSLRHGWIDTLYIRCLSEACARVLARAPAVHLLRELRIPRTVHQSPREPQATGASRLAPLREATALGNVRKFQLGDREREYGWTPQADATGVSEVIRRMPKLEELYIAGSPVDVREIFGSPLPHLRVLEMQYGDYSPLGVLVENGSLSSLTHLLLDGRVVPGADESVTRPGVDFWALRVLADRFPRLSHLRLRLPDLGDTGCAALVESGIVGRLRLLDLRGCGLTGVAADRLAECQDICRLEKLDVNHNAMSEEAVARLQGLEITVVADEQFIGMPPAYGDEPPEDEEMDA